MFETASASGHRRFSITQKPWPDKSMAEGHPRFQCHRCSLRALIGWYMSGLLKKGACFFCCTINGLFSAEMYKNPSNQTTNTVPEIFRMAARFPSPSVWLSVKYINATSNVAETCGLNSIDISIPFSNGEVQLGSGAFSCHLTPTGSLSDTLHFKEHKKNSAMFKNWLYIGTKKSKNISTLFPSLKSSECKSYTPCTLPNNAASASKAPLGWAETEQSAFGQMSKPVRTVRVSLHFFFLLLLPPCKLIKLAAAGTQLVVV